MSVAIKGLMEVISKKRQNKTEWKEKREMKKKYINQGKKKVSPHQHRATPLYHP